MPCNSALVRFSSVSFYRPCSVQVGPIQPWIDGNSAPLEVTALEEDLDHVHIHSASPTTPASSMSMDPSMTPSRSTTPGGRLISHPSTEKTTESSPSEPLSLSSFSLPGPAIGDRSAAESQPMRNATSDRQLIHRTRLSHLDEHLSTTRPDDESHPGDTPSARSGKRRSFSAVLVDQVQAKWMFPDRYVSPRLRNTDTPAFRLSKSPSSLRGRELYYRQRDYSADPFQSFSESRSQQEESRRSASSSYGLRTPRYTPSFAHGVDAGPVNLDPRRNPDPPRHPSWIGFWNVGSNGSTEFSQLRGIPTGDGRRLASGTNAPMITSGFLKNPTVSQHGQSQEARLALALDIDLAARVLNKSTWTRDTAHGTAQEPHTLNWRDGAWGRHYSQKAPILKTADVRNGEKIIPTVPFRVLDAPQLKDDYYCSILAYCYTSHTLAVALTNKVYLWTEEYGVRFPPLPPTKPANFVTSLAFSSDGGAKSILAVARHKGNVTLWSLLETRPRFEAPHPCPASCVAFRPRVTHRPAADGRHVECEDLIVGDDNGRIYYYSVDWPDTGAGSMSLLVKLNAHAQNICGFAWAPDGQKFVSGGNDNVALLFTVDAILGQADQNGSVRDRNIAGSQGHDISNGKLTTGIATPPASPQRAYIRGAHPNLEQLAQPDNIPYGPTLPPSPAQSPQRTRQTSQLRKQHYQIEEVSTLRNALANPTIPGVPNLQTFALYHAAAVKAVAFAPWQANLLATGGGSNDRQIHFYHTGSGAALAVINVFAQVTSLVWSTTRRELAVTFGYAQPDHEIRIAVFSWPDCKCVVSIPWERKANGEIGRALWAIPYPGGPNDAVPTRKQSGDGFSAWENARLAEARRRRAAAEAAEAEVRDDSDEARGRSMSRGSLGGCNRSRSTPAARRRRQRERQLASSRANSTVRGEGETWASRTEEEGSLIIACCDQTVKFFEVWAGKSKGSGGGKGLGTRPGVLGGSRILEGWCEGIGELGSAYRKGKWSEEDEGIR